MALQPPAGLDPVDYIEQTRRAYDALGYEPYRWAHNPDAPPINPPVDLSRSRVAVVASGGIYRVGQVAFNHKDDTSHRRIPVDVDPADLRISHFAYDTTDAKADPEVVFPVAALRALVTRPTLRSCSRSPHFGPWSPMARSANSPPTVSPSWAGSTRSAAYEKS